MAKQIILLSLVALSFGFIAFAFEPSPLQDFCVGDSTTSARVNGMVCKNSASVTASDFSFSGLHLPGNTSNPTGSRVTPVTVAQLPGLNTLGISMVRVDYAPWGMNPPHTHPRATEILTVIEGTLQVGFVTSNPDNSLITKTLYKGDVFVFPVGLVHFQRNVGTTHAVAIAALSSQNPGVITIANAVFGSKPAISSDILGIPGGSKCCGSTSDQILEHALMKPCLPCACVHPFLVDYFFLWSLLFVVYDFFVH